MCRPQGPAPSHPPTLLAPPSPAVGPEPDYFMDTSTVVPIAAAFPVIYYLLKCVLRTLVKSLQAKGGEKAEEKASAIGKTALVTSATTAVSIGAVKELNAKGAVVYMLCKDLQRGQEVRRELTDLGCDPTRLILKVLNVEDFNAVREFADDFQKEVDRLDILINNKGLIFRPESDVETTSSHNRELGHFLLTELMLPLIRRSKQGHIVVVSSRLSDEQFADSQESNRTQSTASYLRTEQANLMYVRELRRRLREEDRSCSVLVSTCHPQALYEDVHGSVLKSESCLAKIKRSFLWFCTKTITDGVQASLFAVMSRAVSKFCAMLFRDPNKAKPYVPDSTVSRYIYEESMRAVGLKMPTRS
ncbi:Retinol dehydrogenase 14 [Toxocara canis]|uniref:Retinol dehydrogenase 14 n=1 Tax=Toxocara canis TaxID=6265 RepID=A0A0B2UWD3_TOXCA|nr:Retinol dehydrogenase 14 [Toxocara canis]